MCVWITSGIFKKSITAQYVSEQLKDILLGKTILGPIRRLDVELWQ